MNRKERFCSAYKYVCKKFGYVNQTQVAEEMQVGRDKISSALAGREQVLTDKFLQKFNSTFGCIFNLQWLISGEGEMLAAQKNNQIIMSSHHITQNGNIIEGNSKSIQAIMQEYIDGFQAELRKQRELTERALTELAEQRKQTNKLLNILENQMLGINNK